VDAFSRRRKVSATSNARMVAPGRSPVSMRKPAAWSSPDPAHGTTAGLWRPQSHDGADLPESNRFSILHLGGAHRSQCGAQT
jgi:hypothetical protein